MWEKFVESLPIAAQSPFAVLLYLCLLFAYVFVAIYTHHLKKISKSLALVPENQRAALLAKEYSTFPKSGLSPNQWLASRRQLFRFLAFLATLIAGTIILIMSINLSRGSKNPDSVAAAQTPSQQNTVNGSNNNTGNVNQSGDNNTSIIGNDNAITTYKVTEPKLSDWLVPGKEPTPDPPPGCDPPTLDHLMVLYGDSVSFIPLKNAIFPHTVIKIGDKPKLTINKDKRGRMALSVDIYDERGYIIAQIENNRFTVNRNNYFKMTKTHSTLAVVDQRNQKVLDFRFINPKTIRLDALLWFPELNRPVVLSEDGNNLGGRNLKVMCVAGASTDVHIVP